eukprot:7391534-Prymnesium_polylepis.1
MHEKNLQPVSFQLVRCLDKDACIQHRGKLEPQQIRLVVIDATQGFGRAVAIVTLLESGDEIAEQAHARLGNHEQDLSPRVPPNLG